MFHQKKMIGKKFEKNNVTIALNVLCANKKNTLLMFQNATQIVNKRLFF